MDVTEEQKTELIYLQDLVFESARWRISEDDDLSPIEREVRSRLDTLQAALNGEEPETEKPWYVRDLEAARLNEHLDKSANRKVKINYNGRAIRMPVYMLEQQPCKSSHTGYSWVVKDEYRSEADAKLKLLDAPLRANEEVTDKLSDEFWAEHENAAGAV